ncbi:hypothetical protein [Actinoplanes utahensis]|uniref:Uncharacterized protein n=1 Tax=Actinoplanes utahensis TaxID=1869 RepID=A0A0A6US69_ACTUT|nr:hypothetical protein [Actinoplanes utahensis]KHD78985.1 hypothetical protein MB27_02610 [Actinoplanes utahensis]GIF28026.1 hypothetical protein Aut01nite_10120 [Actinoplanes utahensis]
MPSRFTGRVERWQTAARRATAVPFIIRCGILFIGLLALAVAWPVEMLSSPRYMSVVAAAVIWPAVAPQGKGGTAAALAVIAGWLIDTAGFGSPVTLWRVLALATLLYLAHTLTALAAVLPYDAVVNLDVPALWLGRALIVVLISAVVIVLALGLTADLGGDAFQIATLVGLAAATAVTILLARMTRRE